MTSLTPLAEGRHNHPPRCCCLDPNDDTGQGSAGRCPGCSEHGALAAGIRCPQCKTEIGRPHTDYCTLSPGAVCDGLLDRALHPSRYWSGGEPVDPAEMRAQG